MDKMLTTKQVQEQLNIGRDKALQLIESGRLKSLRLGAKTIRTFQSSVDQLKAEAFRDAE